MIFLENYTLDVKNKLDLYQCISFQLLEKKYIYSKKNFLQKIFEREKIGSLYIGNGILLPHIQNKTIRKNRVCVYRLKNNIENEINLVICILAKKNLGRVDYQKIVQFVRAIDDEKVIKKLMEGKIWKLEK